MVEILRVGLGGLLICLGGLAVINHALVDRFNRTVKSIGTKQTPDEIEMSGLGILVGRIGGVLTVLYGAGIAVNGF